MNHFIAAESLDWTPYKIGMPSKIRPMNTLEDRIRVAAFAERQAYYAFTQAAKIFLGSVPKELINAWKKIAEEEAKHEKWLLNRLDELNINVQEMTVSLGLYNSFVDCQNARDFTLYISDSEEKGRIAGIKFADFLKDNDPISAKIFTEIANEEVFHISLAKKYFFTGPLK
jgi:uncharacterized ferritin-like protein (DUF455 family)